MVIGVPMTPEGGVTLSDNGVVGKVGVGSIGPGNGATPGIAGDFNTIGVVAFTTLAGNFFVTVVTLCFAGEAALMPLVRVAQNSALAVTPIASTLTVLPPRCLVIMFSFGLRRFE
jgi:hypothetical protein